MKRVCVEEGVSLQCSFIATWPSFFVLNWDYWDLASCFFLFFVCIVMVLLGQAVELGRLLSEDQPNKIAVGSDSACSLLWGSRGTSSSSPCTAVTVELISSRNGFCSSCPVGFVEQQSLAFGNEGLQVWVISWSLPCSQCHPVIGSVVLVVQGASDFYWGGQGLVNTYSEPGRASTFN